MNVPRPSPVPGLEPTVELVSGALIWMLAGGAMRTTGAGVVK